MPLVVEVILVDISVLVLLFGKCIELLTDNSPVRVVVPLTLSSDKVPSFVILDCSAVIILPLRFPCTTPEVSSPSTVFKTILLAVMLLVLRVSELGLNDIFELTSKSFFVTKSPESVKTSDKLPLDVSSLVIAILSALLELPFKFALTIVVVNVSVDGLYFIPESLYNFCFPVTFLPAY